LDALKTFALFENVFAPLLLGFQLIFEHKSLCFGCWTGGRERAINPHKKLFTSVIVVMSVIDAAELEINACPNIDFYQILI
jgi:hypothetical protein